MVRGCERVELHVGPVQDALYHDATFEARMVSMEASSDDRMDMREVSSACSWNGRVLIRLVFYSISVRIKVVTTSLRLNINLTLRLINRSELLDAHF